MNRRAISSVFASVALILFTVLVAGGLYFMLSHQEKTKGLPSISFSLRASSDGKSAILTVSSISRSILWSHLNVSAFEDGKRMKVEKPSGTVSAGDEAKILGIPGGLLTVKVTYQNSIVWQGSVYLPSGGMQVPVKFEMTPCGNYHLELKVLSVQGSYNWEDLIFSFFCPIPSLTAATSVDFTEIPPSGLNSSMVGPVEVGQTFVLNEFNNIFFNSSVPVLLTLIDPSNLQILGEYLYSPSSLTINYGGIPLHVNFPSSLISNLTLFPSLGNTPKGTISATATWDVNYLDYDVSVVFSSLSSSLDPLDFVPILFVTPYTSSGGTNVDPVEYNISAVYSSSITAGSVFSFTIHNSYQYGAQAVLYLLYIPTSKVIAETTFSIPAPSSSTVT